MSKEEKQDYWSECGQIYFHYGQGYGVTAQLQSICLGCEEDIKRYLKTGKHNSLQPLQEEVLDEVITYRKEQGIGTDECRARGMARESASRTTRSRKGSTRHTPKRRRISVRKAKL